MLKQQRGDTKNILLEIQVILLDKWDGVEKIMQIYGIL